MDIFVCCQAYENLLTRGFAHKRKIHLRIKRENGSPTKPARRLETIAAAGELQIPFTSGILVGIGETEQERMDSLAAIAELHERHGHIQEVILQNFVPAPALLRPRAGRDRRRRRARVLAHGREPDPAPDGVAADGPRCRCPTWARPVPVSIEDMKRLIAEARRLMPDVGIQIPPNLADWWGELVAAGRDRPRRAVGQRRPHLPRAPVPLAAPGAQASCSATATR